GGDGARKGMIMDGFPRTEAQAEAVDKLLATRKTKIDKVLNFEVPDDELVRRMAGRAAAEGRTDDKPDAFRKRLEVYREQTAPLIDYYRKRKTLSDVPGLGTVEEISGRVRKAIGK